MAGFAIFGVILGALSASSADRCFDPNVAVVSPRRCNAVCPATVCVVFDGPELRVVCDPVSNKAIDEAHGLSDEDVLGRTVDELIQEIMARHDMETSVLDSTRGT